MSEYPFYDPDQDTDEADYWTTLDTVMFYGCVVLGVAFVGYLGLAVYGWALR